MLLSTAVHTHVVSGWNIPHTYNMRRVRRQDREREGEAQLDLVTKTTILEGFL